MKDMSTYVEKLIKWVADSSKSEDALRSSQAACNVANAIRVMEDVTEKSKT